MVLDNLHVAGSVGNIAVQTGELGLPPCFSRELWFLTFGTLRQKKLDKNRVSGFLPFLPSSREERYFFRIGNNQEKTTVFSL